MSTDHAATREARGRKVREAWVNYCLETGDTKPSHIAPWEELSEWDKEADRRIGDAVATALQAERDEARRELAAERYLHREEIAGLQKQIDYAAKYGERDHSMGQPQPRRPTIHEQLAAERARVKQYSAALSMVEDIASDAAGDDGSFNDIRRSMGLPTRDDLAQLDESEVTT